MRTSDKFGTSAGLSPLQGDKGQTRNQIGRRNFIGGIGAVAATGAASAALAQEPEGGSSEKNMKVVGISCSPRKGKTTAEGLGVCLEAAEKGVPELSTELIELAEMEIPVFDPGSKEKGDFQQLIPKLADPNVVGIIIGSPVYFSQMTSLCKAFLDHCAVFRSRDFAWRDKVAGVLAVGGVRNGGQELTIASIQNILLCQAMVVVGDGTPTAHTGATLLNTNDTISGDDFGLKTARNLGKRVAKVGVAMG